MSYLPGLSLISKDTDITNQETKFVNLDDTNNGPPVFTAGLASDNLTTNISLITNYAHGVFESLSIKDKSNLMLNKGDTTFLYLDTDGNIKSKSFTDTVVDVSFGTLILNELVVSSRSYNTPKYILPDLVQIDINLADKNHFEINIPESNYPNNYITLNLLNTVQGQAGHIVVKHVNELIIAWTSNDEIKWQGGSPPTLELENEGTETYAIISYFCSFNKILMGSSLNHN